jgi:16S rRNA processing protein RimM
MPPDAQEWMLVGTVVGPFGVRGEAKVELHTDFPDRFKGLKQVFLGPDRRPMRIERSRRHKGRVLLKLAGTESPEQVEGLRGWEIFVPRSEAVPLPAGHYFLDDAIGIDAFSADGPYLGRVSEVLRTGNHEVFVVNEGRDSLLVPIVKDAVRELDVPRRRLVVEPWVLRKEE